MKEEQFGSLRFFPGEAFPLSTDSVLLSRFVRASSGERICDLGCGGGALPFLLLSRDPSLNITGIELLPQAAQTARENIARNALEDHFRLIEGDLRQIRDYLPAGSFSVVVSNPPYFPVGSGAVRADTLQALATSEATCSPTELFSAAAWLLPWGGRFFLVHRPERLSDLFCAGRAQRLEAKRIQYVRSRSTAVPSLVLLEFRKGGSSGLRHEPDLLLEQQTSKEGN